MPTSQKRKTNKNPSKRKQRQAEALPVSEPLEQSEEGLKKDLFDDLLFQAADYFYRRRKFYIALSIVIVVSAVIGYGIFKYMQFKVNQRNEQLFKIEQIIQKEKITKEQRYETAMPLLKKFIDTYPDTRQQNLALFYRSRLNFDQTRYQESETDLRRLLALLEKDSELFVLASVYLSNVLIDQDKNDEAIQILEDARSDIMTDIILMALSEIYINSNQIDKAKQTLEILMRDYPKSLYIQRARQLQSLL